MPIQYLCACPPDSEITLLAKLNNNLNVLLKLLYPSFVGNAVNMAACPCTPLQILQSINRNIILAAAAAGGASAQTGRMALVNGQQSYAIVFPTPFAAVPDFVDASVMMVSSSGENFFANVDLSTLTVNGVTVWLSGVPTAGSVGSYLTWTAIP